MAFFKFRKGGDAAPSAPAQADSVEALRRRARHRLIGAAVLVLLGVVGFPLLFDTQPRPVSVNIPIDIPDRSKAKPLAVPPPLAAPAAVGTVAEPVAAPAPAVASAPVAVAAPAEPAPALPRPEVKTDVRPEPQSDAPKAPAKLASKPDAKPQDDGMRAQALLDGKPPAAAGDERFIVQVGAFADAGKAREVRLKVEKAGLKTYTHVAETPEGRRIRVRVGPFPTRAEADKAAKRIKDLDLPAAILTL